jgi:ATP-binding cassette subfamily C protein
LQTAHDADRVAVMDAGRVVEVGSHDELVAAGGAYAALWRTWHGSQAPA